LISSVYISNFLQLSLPLFYFILSLHLYLPSFIYFIYSFLNPYISFLLLFTFLYMYLFLICILFFSYFISPYFVHLFMYFISLSAIIPLHLSSFLFNCLSVVYFLSVGSHNGSLCMLSGKTHFALKLAVPSAPFSLEQSLHYVEYCQIQSSVWL
jgi:hypothetical protein